MEFTNKRLSQKEIDEISNKIDEISSGWRFRLTLCYIGSQAGYYNVMHNSVVRKLLLPEIVLTYDDKKGLYVCEGNLRQIPRPYFAMALFESMLQEIPKKTWHIQIWNTDEREWHFFEGDLHAHGYTLEWSTTDKGFKFNHVEIPDDLWLHAVQFADRKVVELLTDYEPHRAMYNGYHIGAGECGSINAGEHLFSLVIHSGGSVVLSSGGILESAYVENGGVIAVREGALLSGCSMASNGELIIRGSARDIVINGKCDLYGEVSSCTVLDSGHVTVHSSGWIKFSKVSSGGFVSLAHDGYAAYVHVLSGGIIDLRSGANADALTISSGGSAYVDQAARACITKSEGGLVRATTTPK